MHTIAECVHAIEKSVSVAARDVGLKLRNSTELSLWFVGDVVIYAVWTLVGTYVSKHTTATTRQIIGALRALPCWILAVYVQRLLHCTCACSLFNTIHARANL